jgi:hypothetical protein
VIIVIVAFVLVGGSITVLGVLASGNVSGTEFSPTTFSTRTFGYCEIPLVHLQVTPVVRVAQSGPLETLLQAEKLLPPATGQSTEAWHLVSVERAGVVQQGDAELLVKYLRGSSFGTNPAAMEWTQKNPELAKVFWPIVARLARRNEYLLAPDLFELARTKNTPQELKAAMHEHLANRYYRWAKIERDLNHQTPALELLGEALVHAKDLPKLHRELTIQRGQWSAE